MNPPEITPAADSKAPSGVPSDRSGKEPKQPARQIALVACLALLGLLFANTLFSLVGYATGTTLFSYILSIPFCSAYLIYIQSRTLPKTYACSPGWAAVFLVAGVAAWLVGSGLLAINPAWSPVDFLALKVFSFVCSLIALGFLFLGRKWMAAVAFPIAFLFFMIPLPDRVLNWMEVFLQSGSAEAANLLLSISGMAFSRDGLAFHLPGFSMQVAQECSGIQASWILFVSTVLASYMFLQSPWRRVVLILFVIPLGIVRNGFRIVTIGLLCVHVGPHMIDSIIHRRGGPLFLSLSLIPLSIILWWLRRGEVQRQSLPVRSGIGPPQSERKG